MMNLKRIDGVVAGYASTLDAADQARLAFFRTLWDEQAHIAETLARGYTPPEDAALTQLSQAGEPILRHFPADVEEDAFAQAAARMAQALCAGGGFAASTREAVEAVAWPRICAPLAPVAATDPQAALERATEYLKRDGLIPEAQTIAASALSLALRALLEPASDAAMAARDAAGLADAHPVHCPVCGCGATLASVAAATDTAGGSRQLFCAQCGAAWNFERIRCARCGTRNQGHLHYYHVGDDDAHRIHTCDECGGYVRTVFQSSILTPLALDVENVVMAKLDLVAQQRAAKQER